MLIDYNKFGTSVKDQRIQETEQYRKILISQGMEEISKDELIEKLTEIGYIIVKSDCHKYYNNMNQHNYNAISMSYNVKGTRTSYAHFEQRYKNAENLEKLQKIRQNYFVFDGKNIWDL